MFTKCQRGSAFIHSSVCCEWFENRNPIFIDLSLPLCFSIFRSRIYFGDYVRDRCREDMNNPYYSIPQSQSSAHHHHQQQSVATSTADVEQLNNNNNSSNNNSMIISPPSSLQLHPSSQTSLTSSSTTSATSNQQQQTITPSVLYTVQRVVSTSQLQQLPSNYGNNSNASSLTSIIARNETDCGLPNNNGESPLTLHFSSLYATSRATLTVIIGIIIRSHKNWQALSLRCNSAFKLSAHWGVASPSVLFAAELRV